MTLPCCALASASGPEADATVHSVAIAKVILTTRLNLAPAETSPQRPS